MAVKQRRVDKSPEEPRAGGTPYPERYTAALERALQEALLALVALSHQRQELSHRLREITQVVATAEAPADAVRHVCPEERAAAGGIA